MNNQSIVISCAIILATAGGTSVSAAPVEVSMAAGLLGSPIAQLPMQDPLVQKAIEWIQSKQLKPIDQKEKANPAKTIGERLDTNRRLILGGPEIIPM